MKPSDLPVKIHLKGPKRPRPGNDDASGGPTHSKKKQPKLSSTLLGPATKLVASPRPTAPEKTPSREHVKAWLTVTSEKELRLLSNWLEQRKMKYTNGSRGAEGVVD